MWHTHIIAHYNPFSQDYDLASHTTVVCVNFINERVFLQFKVDSEGQFFRCLSWCFVIVFARNLLRGSPRRNIFKFSFLPLVWGLKSGLMSNKTTHCLLDYGDFIMCGICLLYSQLQLCRLAFKKIFLIGVHKGYRSLMLFNQIYSTVIVFAVV